MFNKWWLDLTWTSPATKRELESIKAHLYARDTLNDFVRSQMNEMGFQRKIIPPLNIGKDDLDRSYPTDKPVKFMDQPNTTALVEGVKRACWRKLFKQMLRLGTEYNIPIKMVAESRMNHGKRPDMQPPWWHTPMLEDIDARMAMLEGLGVFEPYPSRAVYVHLVGNMLEVHLAELNGERTEHGLVFGEGPNQVFNVGHPLSGDLYKRAFSELLDEEFMGTWGNMGNGQTCHQCINNDNWSDQSLFVEYKEGYTPFNLVGAPYESDSIPGKVHN